MGFIYSLLLVALLSCSTQRTTNHSAVSGGGLWPDKIVQVECVNEPGMESKIIQSLGGFPICGIQVRYGSCCLSIEATLITYHKHLYREVEYRLRETPGVLSVSFK